LPKTSRMTLNLFTNMLDLRQESTVGPFMDNQGNLVAGDLENRDE